jgi:hypothetical protein
MLGGAFVALSDGCLTIFGQHPGSCDTREAVGSTMMIAGIATIRSRSCSTLSKHAATVRANARQRSSRVGATRVGAASAYHWCSRPDRVGQSAFRSS